MEGISSRTLSKDQIRKILHAHHGSISKLATRRDPPWATGHVSLVLSGDTQSAIVWSKANTLALELVAKIFKILNPEAPK